MPAGLDPFTGATRELEVDGADVAEVVAGLERALPGVAGHLVDGGGRLRAHLLCLVDGTATRDLATPVGDEVAFLTAVSGGAA
nr:MoaD/ThiS family protein [Salsipaludibacter albus]